MPAGPSAITRPHGRTARHLQRSAAADGANTRKADLAFPEIATVSNRPHARSNADNAHGSPRLHSLHVGPGPVTAGQAGWSALWHSLTCGVLDAVTEPDADGPQRRENAAKKIHNGHDAA